MILKLKQMFHQHKRPISMKNIDIGKILMSNQVPFGKIEFKYFIGYKHAIKNKPLCVFLSKMTAYKREFDETKIYVFFEKRLI